MNDPDDDPLKPFNDWLTDQMLLEDLKETADRADAEEALRGPNG